LSEKDDSVKPTPKTTLQLMILYPTLLLSLIGAVPTVVKEIKAWHLGVEAAKLPLIQEQDELWKRNLDCVTQAASWEVDGPKRMTVKITLCKSTGDALLRYFRDDWQPTYRWVRAPEKWAKE